MERVITGMLDDERMYRIPSEVDEEIKRKITLRMEELEEGALDWKQKILMDHTL